MAIAAQVHPSLPPQPPARRTVAGLACPCPRLAWTAVRAVICLFIASLWLLYWGLAAMDIGRFFCGWRSAVVTVALKVAFVAGVTLVPVLPLILLLDWMLTRARAAAAVPVAAAAATDVEATKVQEPVLKTSDFAMRARCLLREPVIHGFLASMAFALLMVTGVVVVGDGNSTRRRYRMGSVIYYLGALGLHTVDCFILCPLITVEVWWSWRKARQVL